VLRILFTNIGRKTYFLDFAVDLKNLGYPIELHVSDRTYLAAGLNSHSIIKRHILPSVLKNKEKYIKELYNLVKKNKINTIIPLTDYDLDVLALNIVKFKKIGCYIIVSKISVVKTCFNKILTFKKLNSNNILTPKIIELNNDTTKTLPLIKKNIFGSGSSGFKIIKNEDDLKKLNMNTNFLQKFIKGKEYGVDILNDLKGNFISLCIKKKLSMRSGETDKAEIIYDNKITYFCKKISKVIGHYGNLDCDIIKDKNGRLFCVDLNPRFGGGYPATHLAGMNYLRVIFDILLKKKYFLPIKPKKIRVLKGVSVHVIK